MAAPEKKEADAGGEEAGAEAAVKPGEEIGGDAGNVLQSDTEGNHKSDYEIAFEAEGTEDTGFLLRHGYYASGVLVDHPCEHHVKSCKDQDGQRYHPQEVLRPVHQEIMTHPGDGDLRPYGRPEKAVYCKKVFSLYFTHNRVVIKYLIMRELQWISGIGFRGF